MSRPLRTIALCLSCMLMLAGLAHSHEFWIVPDRFRAPAGSSVSVSLSVGEDFSGERVGISTQFVSRFTQYAGGRQTDLRPLLPAQAVGDFTVKLQDPGTHLLAMDTFPTEKELPASEFNDYLKEDGLWRVAERRRAKGAEQLPGRERYRRNIKTLVQVAGTSDVTYARRTGQRLEIVPLSDPAKLRPGEALAFRVFFDGRSLDRALLRFWHRGEGPVTKSSTWTSKHGVGRFVPATSGTWMVSVVHMVPAPAASGFDWDSYWGNLTFELRDQGS